MAKAENDTRSAARQAKDEAIASEPKLAPPTFPLESSGKPMEEFLGRERRHPVAVPGIVENGLVRPIDPTVKLAEHSRVIIVASEAG